LIPTGERHQPRIQLSHFKGLDQIIIGSRQKERAQNAAKDILAKLPEVRVTGAANADAAAGCEIAVLTIPFDGMTDTLAPLADALAGKTVVSTIVPMVFSGGLPRLIPVAEGSAAQLAQSLLPSCEVIGAFHHLSAVSLSNLEEAVDADVLVCGDSARAKAQTMELAAGLAGARAIDAGRLDGAGVIEGFTVALLRINRRYRAHAALRLTHLTTGS